MLTIGFVILSSAINVQKLLNVCLPFHVIFYARVILKKYVWSPQPIVIGYVEQEIFESDPTQSFVLYSRLFNYGTGELPESLLFTLPNIMKSTARASSCLSLRSSIQYYYGNMLYIANSRVIVGILYIIHFSLFLFFFFLFSEPLL